MVDPIGNRYYYGYMTGYKYYATPHTENPCKTIVFSCLLEQHVKVVERE